MTINAVQAIKCTWMRDDEVQPQRKIDRNPIDKRDLDWVDSVLCSQVDPEIFFPEKGGSTRPGKSVCAECAVRSECLAFALTHALDFGIYGGLSDQERKRLRGRGKRVVA